MSAYETCSKTTRSSMELPSSLILSSQKVSFLKRLNSAILMRKNNK